MTQPPDGIPGSRAESELERSEALSARGDGGPELMLNAGADRLGSPRLARRVCQSLRRFITTLRFGGEPATAEGLAAGTGLLTGPSAQGHVGPPAHCPSCSGVGEVTVVDLVALEATWSCLECGHEWKLRERSSLRLDG